MLERGKVELAGADEVGHVLGFGGGKPRTPEDRELIRHHRNQNMKELRPGSSGRSELRVLFAFDPERKAILLVAGNKAGQWKSWYKVNIPIADDRFAAHLDELEG